MTTEQKIVELLRKVPAALAHIKGWSADLNQTNRSACPTERMPVWLASDHSQPPASVSGMLPLTQQKRSAPLADRVNMVERLGSEVMRGHLPNVFAEIGGKAEFRYNRETAVQKAATVENMWVQAQLRHRADPRRHKRAR